jgi:NADPH-dependent ferric siderophore reductase
VARSIGAVTELRTRREPPHFRRVEVARVQRRTPHLVRITFQGPELAGMDPGLPGASVRLLLPPAGTNEVVVPSWNGNEFLFDDGERPVIRTLTPLRFDAGTPELDVEIVLHGDAPLSSWAAAAEPGARGAISGTGRGYEIDPEAPAFLLAGDESALPAIATVLAAIPATATVRVIVEIRDDAARVELPDHPQLTVAWHVLADGARGGDALVAAVLAADLPPDVRVWAAGEAAAVQRIRRHLFDEVGLTRSQAVVRGYWKHGRGGD